MDKSKITRVLLIEDDPQYAGAVRRMLVGDRGALFDLEWATNLSTGLERLSEGGIDAVLLDLGLPDSEGFDTLTRVHSHMPALPIVVLTAAADEALALRTVEAGAQDYLFKGELNREVLTRIIRYAIERQHIVRSLQASEARFRDVVRMNADGIVIVGHEGTVSFANPAAGSLFGMPTEDLVGTNFGFPVTRGESTEIDLVGGGKEPRVAEMRAVEIEWQGEVVCLASLRDVSERKRMEEDLKKTSRDLKFAVMELERSKEELEQTRQQQLRLKDQFISSISHELRSPLSAIHQFVTILLDGLAGEINPEQREYLEIVLRNLSQLRVMIDQLLDATRAETGKLTVEPRPTLLAGMIEETVETLSKDAAAKGILLSTDLPDDLPLVCADQDRIRQVLINLVGNSIKFTPENGTITVRAQICDEDPNFLCLSVADTGWGINAEEKKRIFEYLYQAETPLAVSRKGLGLGLYICKELVSSHGGQIWVESKVGQGSTFIFTLPVFSLPAILAPTLTAKNLEKGFVSLITIEFSSADKRRLGKTDERILTGVLDVVKGCILSNMDVLLPRMGHTEWEGMLFVVACADETGTEVLVSRLEEQLAGFSDLQEAGFAAAVSYMMVDISSIVGNKPVEQVVKGATAKIQELVKEIVQKKKGV
jgi:signal transduction histidine kinase/FixJ family two-component response regulator